MPSRASHMLPATKLPSRKLDLPSTMKLNSNYCKLLALAAGVSLAVPVSSRAAVVLTLQEVGSDVVLSMAAGGTVSASLISGQTSHNQSSAIGTLRNNTTGPQFLLALGSGSSFDSFYFFAVPRSLVPDLTLPSPPPAIPARPSGSPSSGVFSVHLFCPRDTLRVPTWVQPPRPLPARVWPRWASPREPTSGPLGPTRIRKPSP